MIRRIFFTFLLIFLPVVLFAASVQLPQTGQISVYRAGDDGDLQKGTIWPGLRFTNNNDGTVTDNLTGLVWLTNANCFGYQDWNTALNLSSE